MVGGESARGGSASWESGGGEGKPWSGAQVGAAPVGGRGIRVCLRCRSRELPVELPTLGKMSDGGGGRGAFSGGGRLLLCIRARWFREQPGLPEELCTVGFLPGACHPPHLKAGLLAGLGMSSCRQGTRGSRPRSRSAPEWPWGGSPLRASGYRGWEAGLPARSWAKAFRGGPGGRGRRGRSPTGPSPCSTGEKSAFQSIPAKGEPPAEPPASRMVSWG